MQAPDSTGPGYLSGGYAEAFREFGTPRFFPNCGGWIVERLIPGGVYKDAMGCYPLFCCRDWARLHHDIETLSHDLVTLALVTDPFGAYDEDYLRQCFKDVVRPFKKHYVYDLRHPLESIVSKHHRRYAQKGMQRLSVQKCQDPSQMLETWTTLYANLTERHGILNVRAFSRGSFEKQLRVPGLVMFVATSEEVPVGAITWFEQGEVAYGHLAGVSPVGYQLSAAYALYWRSLEYFANRLRWVDYGSVPGLDMEESTGLAWFKKGWSTGTRTAYFCGRIFNHNRYEEIAHKAGALDPGYFPAYRKGEFDEGES